MPSRHHLDVQPNKKDLNKLKKIAKLSKWQKDFLSYLDLKPVLLKSAYKKNTKPIAKRKWTREDLEKMLEVASRMINNIVLPIPTNLGNIEPKPYYDRQYKRKEVLTAHELVYASKVLSKQLDCHIQVDHIDRNRIVEFNAKKGCMSRSKTIRISVKKIKKAYTNKADYIEIRSISTNYPKRWNN